MIMRTTFGQTTCTRTIVLVNNVFPSYCSDTSPILEVDVVQRASGKVNAPPAPPPQPLRCAFPVTHSPGATLEAVDYDSPVDPKPRRVSPAHRRAHFELIVFRVVRPENVSILRRKKGTLARIRVANVRGTRGGESTIGQPVCMCPRPPGWQSCYETENGAIRECSSPTPPMVYSIFYTSPAPSRNGIRGCVANGRMAEASNK